MFLGSGSVNTFLQQQIDQNNRGTARNGVILCGPCQGIILKTTGVTKSVLRGRHEAEESPLSEAVARECLLKTQQADKKGLVGAAVICEFWRLVVAL
jgi:hypothetical protein